MPQLTTNTYTQSGIYDVVNNTYANWSNMNDGNCDTGTATASGTSWVKTDLKSSMLVESIVIGYDRNETIYGGWGTSYSVSGASVGTCRLQSSDNDSTWTDVVVNLPNYTTAGSPSNGLATVTVNTTCRYLRIYSPFTYFALTEFQVNATASNFFLMF